MCLYDGVSGTPAGGCSDVAPGDAWSQAPKGFRFQRPASAGGITSIRLEAGEAGQAELTVKGREVALPALPLAQQPEVVLELSNSAGECWQSRFATATRNDGSKFVARE